MESDGQKSHLLSTDRLVRSGGSKLQRVADDSIGVIVLRKRWEKPRSGENLIGFYEISLDLVEISSDSMRFHQIRSKSHQIYLISSQNLGFFTGIWKFFSPKYRFFARIWAFLGRFRFFRFWGRETKTNPPGSVFWWWRPATDRWSGRVGWHRIRSDRFLLWVKSSDGFGQPYLSPWPFKEH